MPDQTQNDAPAGAQELAEDNPVVSTSQDDTTTGTAGEPVNPEGDTLPPNDPTQPAADDVVEQSPIVKAREQHGLPEGWSDGQVEVWLKNADLSKGVTNEDGVFLFDPTRSAKAPNVYTPAELLAFLKGELQGVPSGKAAAVISEYRKIEDVPAGWSTDQVLAFYREGTTPETTASGVLKKDATRGTRKVGDWTDAELVAWVQGEITNVGPNTDTLIAKEVHARFKLVGYADDPINVRKRYKAQLENAAAAAPAQQQQVAAAAAGGSDEAPQPVIQYTGALTAMNVQFIDETLTKYEATVAPGRNISDNIGGQAQRALENLFQYILRQDDPKVIVEMLDRVKAFVKTHRAGVFEPSMAYRFVHELKGGQAAQNRHVNFIELFVIITDSNKGRRQQADVRALLAGTPADKQAILIDYFTHTK